MSNSTENTKAERLAQQKERLTQEPIIKVRQLLNQFGDHVVHEHLDMDIYPGEIIGIVGGSGTGKSVLLRAIIGLRPPNQGEITIFGKELSKLPQRERSQIERRFGVLFQQGALFSSLSVLENVAMPLIEQANLVRSDAEQIARLKMALAGLPAHSANLMPSELSGGMVKRAALARALALDPDILFLDEPTAGLDPIGASEFDQLILTLRDALGLTVCLITHDLDTLYTICDRVAVLSQKRVIINDSLAVVEKYNDPWVQDYFQGPRGRAAQQADIRRQENT